MRSFRAFTLAVAVVLLSSGTGALAVTIPDGRAVDPAGFTMPVESFAATAVPSPDGHFLAILSNGVSEDVASVEIVALDYSLPVERLALPSASAVAWTADGLFVAQSATGTISHYTATFGKRDISLKKIGAFAVGPGLIDGLAEDPATHRLAVARTAAQSVSVLDATTGRVTGTHPASGQPFAVAFAGDALFATLYNSDHIDVWSGDGADATHVATGPHPTQMLVAAGRVFVANADGHEVVAIDPATRTIAKRYDLAISANAPPGQTPAGMALSEDGTTLFVAESGYNDVAVLDLASGRVRARIPSAWYPTAVATVARKIGSKDPRTKQQLWIVSAKGLGSHPDPGGEWDGTYSGLLQHIVVEPRSFARWSATVARDDRFSSTTPRSALPPVKHVVFIVRENKHFDEEFGDEPGANADPALLLYGRKYTPNAHKLAEQYTLMDDFMTDGEASIYGHAWTTQGMVNDYQERNAHTRNESDGRSPIASSIWPYPIGGEESVTPSDMDADWFTNLADLPKGPRVNVSGVFGPRGELIDELQRKHVSFRVFGDQMTMLPDGRIAPGLADHADKAYPGDHINFGVLDTVRAKLFLDDVQAHGLATYSYLTLSTDHTAGSRAGFYTPASYVASNDVALGTIVAGLAKRPEWKDTVVFVTCDVAQGTGDHVDSHRMPAIAIGPYVRRGFVDHTHYSQTSILRTVEVLFGLDPLNVYDAAATPIVNAFARQAAIRPYGVLASNIPMEKNPGTAKSLSFAIDGPDAAEITNEEWLSVRGPASFAAHLAYLHHLGMPMNDIARSDDDRVEPGDRLSRQE